MFCAHFVFNWCNLFTNIATYVWWSYDLYVLWYINGWNEVNFKHSLWPKCSARFTYRLCRLKPRASRSKGASNKLVRIESMASIWSFRLNFVKNLCLNYYSRNLVLFNSGGDNARVFPRVSMNLSMTVGQATCHILCRYTQSTLAASCVCWIVPIATFDSIKRTCGCLCLKCTCSVA